MVKRYITLRDIAEESGVSVNTVSRALKNRADIGPETIARVKKIASDLGYVPHMAASNLRSGGSKSIGVIVTHIDNAFFSRILQGVSDCVSKLGYTVIILSSNEDVETERNCIQLLTAYRVSGILVVPANDLEQGVDHASIRVPHIEIVRCGGNGSFFVANSRRSGELAAERFAALGKTKAAYLGFDRPVSCNRERMQGFADRAKQLKIKLGRKAFRNCLASSESAFETMTQWIKDGFDYDALFVYNDTMAFGALCALSDAGIRVPDEVSVIGHDDIDIASSFIPRLTTVHVPKYRLGFESAQALLDRINGSGDGKPLNQQVIYEPELMVRKT